MNRDIFTEEIRQIMHPVIEEIGRVFHLNNVRDQAFRRWQRLLRDEVQPLLDERDVFIEENARLREEVLLLQKQTERKAKKEATSV
jgi:hypothetical protein